MKILIVEDEKELAADIGKYLLGENYLCEQVAGKIFAYDYDCIFLDLMLPGGADCNYWNC